MALEFRRRAVLGETLAAIGADYGVTGPTVGLYTKGIPRVGPGGRGVYDRAAIVARLDRGERQHAIATALGCTKALVSHVWRELQEERGNVIIGQDGKRTYRFSYQQWCAGAAARSFSGPGRGLGRAQLRVIQGGAGG